jgi:hypothetical protein
MLQHRNPVPHCENDISRYYLLGMSWEIFSPQM